MSVFDLSEMNEYKSLITLDTVCSVSGKTFLNMQTIAWNPQKLSCGKPWRS